MAKLRPRRVYLTKTGRYYFKNGLKKIYLPLNQGRHKRQTTQNQTQQQFNKQVVKVVIKNGRYYKKLRPKHNKNIKSVNFQRKLIPQMRESTYGFKLTGRPYDHDNQVDFLYNKIKQYERTPNIALPEVENQRKALGINAGSQTEQGAFGPPPYFEQETDDEAHKKVDEILRKPPRSFTVEENMAAASKMKDDIIAKELNNFFDDLISDAEKEGEEDDTEEKYLKMFIDARDKLEAKLKKIDIVSGNIDTIDRYLNRHNTKNNKPNYQTLYDIATSKTGSGFGKKNKFRNWKQGLYDDEIEDIMMHKTKRIVPVIMSDEIPKLLPLVNKKTDVFGFVINDEPSTKQGNHWRACFIDIPSAEIDYYDSLVSHPTKKFMHDIKLLVDKINPDVYLKLKTNMIQQQSNKSNNCGFFAMKFLIDRFHGKKFVDATKFNDVVKGERFIKKFKTFI